MVGVNQGLVNSEMLALARKARGLTQSALAHEVDMHQSLLTRYEGGHREIPVEDLSLIAEKLGFPESFFWRQSGIVSSISDSIWHRARASLPVRVLHSAYASAGIRWLEVEELAKRYDFGDVALPFFPREEHPYPEEVAAMVRAGWGLQSGPVHNVTRLLESHGCVVFAHPFGHRKLDAFSVRMPGRLAFIHINEDLPSDRWRYTLAHELGHLVMHSDPGYLPVDPERDAHSFAAAFLMPADDIRDSLSDLSISSLAALKLEWKVSMSSLVKRAGDLETVLPSQAKSLHIRLSKAGWKMREPEHIDPPREFPGKAWEMVKYHLMTLGWTRAELRGLLHINEEDFGTYYRDWADKGSVCVS